VELLEDPARAAAWCCAKRAAGRTLGLVSTMGALHRGHLELVRRAVDECDEVAVSVFVNPLQFNDPRDLERYPRDLAGDARLLAGAGAHLLFTGSLAGFFPGARGVDDVPRVDPGPASLGLEGSFRPGHFEGVATICRRLFELVEPRRAYFGAKDFQQCLVVTHVAAARGGPEIVVCPTVREPDGLALSSRNLLLPAAERPRALALSRGLRAARAAWSEGERRAEALTEVLRSEVEGEGVTLEYAEVRDPERWSATAPRGTLARARALVAAVVGGVRLIDNESLDGPSALR